MGETMMKFALMLVAMALISMPAHAADSRPLTLAKTPAAFQALIKLLRKAAAEKDADTIHGKLAQDYYLTRDFGGVFNPKATPKVNFSWNFQFDNSQLSPEYKDHGWKAFRQRINMQKFERKKDGELCMPHGAMDKKPFPHGQLCFRKNKKSQWLIAGHINGGD